MLRLVIWLNKPLSRYYRNDEYLKGLNDMNTIIGINIHLFIIGSPNINLAALRDWQSLLVAKCFSLQLMQRGVVCLQGLPIILQLK